jgi:uncharacterized protein (DUF2249 family)
MSDVNPTLEQQVFHVSPRQREAHISSTTNRITSGEELK